MAGKQKQTLSRYLRDLEEAYRHGDEQDMKNVLQKMFDIEDADLYSLVLAICRESRSTINSKKKSITEMALDEFKDWLDTHDQLTLTRNHKDEAMSYLVTSGIMFTDQLKDIYQLDKGSDRNYLAAHLKYIYDSKNDPKTAANIAVKLKLQDFIDSEEIPLPLLTADKFQVADELMKDSPKLQNKYAEMLDKLCSMQEDEVFDYIQNKKRLRIVDKTKFRSKTLQKISEKFIKKYNLDAAKFPHVFREKNLRSVHHVLGNRYKSPSSEHAKWDGNLEAAVANDTWLQNKLILMIAYEHRDVRNAAVWARKLNLPKDSLPSSVRRQLEENPTSSFQSNKYILPSMSNCADDSDDYDDYDDDGGFLFASDDVTYDETLEVKNAAKESQHNDRYWSYPLLPENIKFINVFRDLQNCIKIVFKPGNLIGFDSEWQPKYGRAGQKDKIAILQLAVGEQVFIVDVMEFNKTAEGQKLLKELFRKLFTSENTLRLGFGIESDVKVIVDNYPYAKEFMDDAQHFEDLQNYSKQIMALPCVKKKLNIENIMQGSERGLSFVVKQCFGKPLDKTYQVSNWEQRPLSEMQIRYAALDALCLVKIYDLFEVLAQEFQIIVSSNGSSAICKNSSGSDYHPVEECVISGPPRRPGQFKVVCDTMLQGLGRNLRSCGVDTVILQNGDEHMKAVELHYQEERVILTKGKPYYQMRGCVPQEMCMSVPDGSAEDQLSTIFRRYNIRVTSKDMLSRCQMCNCDVFVEIKKEHMMLAYWTKNGMRPNENFMTKHQLHPLRGSRKNDTGIDFKYMNLSSGVPLKCECIPLPVFDKVDMFFVCSRCGKIYWEGSHYDKVADQFSSLILDSEEED